jgi:hypothetical protein
MKGKKKTGSNNDDLQLAEISGKLDTLIRLSSLGLIKDMKTQKEQIAALSDAGFQPKGIASILRTSSGSVRVALHDIRKERAAAEAEEETTETTTEADAANPVEETKPEVKEDGEKA